MAAFSMGKQTEPCSRPSWSGTNMLRRQTMPQQTEHATPGHPHSPPRAARASQARRQVLDLNLVHCWGTICCVCNAQAQRHRLDAVLVVGQVQALRDRARAVRGQRRAARRLQPQRHELWHGRLHTRVGSSAPLLSSRRRLLYGAGNH